MNARTIYLDYNATTPLAADVAEAMARCYAEGYVNPESQHAPGRRARAALEDAREGLAQLLGAQITGRDADRLIFTSGGTEANNLALFGLAGAPPARVVVSAIEHPSVSRAADELARRGHQVERLPAARTGLVKLESIEQLAAPDPPGAVPRLASLMLVNNETGVVQPVAALVDRLASLGTLVHTDAVQAVGKLPLDFRALGVAAMTATAHKVSGPRGIGVLIVRAGVPLEPQLFGGQQQLGLRPGTEDVALAVGFHRAVESAVQNLSVEVARQTRLREEFEARLRAGEPELVIHGLAAARVGNTTNVSFPGLDRQQLLLKLDLVGVACSTGSACASGSSDPSPTLVAMGCPEGEIDSSLRFSLGCATTSEEMVEAAARILNVCRQLRNEKTAAKTPVGGRFNG
ncbi:MAG: cysteine desulfurase [Pirellulales bacterium]|nr:cysteine desulfurase [Pirellulales bacterium]